MSAHTGIQIVLLLILILLSGFFSSAETALTTVNRVRIRTLSDSGNKRAATVLSVLDAQEKMLSCILIGNNVVNLSASSLSTTLAISLFGSRSVGLATGILTLLILIFGEITPKNAANVLLASDKDDPILSVMQYGLGHTVAWNTDVTNTWTSGFANEEDYVQLWKRIIDYSAGNASLGEDSLEVETSGEVTTIRYKAQDYKERTSVEAVYTDPDGQTHTVKLSARAPGEYEAKLDTDIPGIYNLSVRRSDDGELKNAITTAAVAQYSDEYKFAADNESFLSFMNRYGRVITPKDSFWKKLKTTSRAAYDLSKWLLILAIVWFLLDVAMRRFAFVPQDSRLYRLVKSRRMAHKNKAAMMAEKRKYMPGAEGISGAQHADAAGKADVQQAQGVKATENVAEQARKTSNKKTSKRKKKQEEVTLDTSALLKKKDLRDH